MTTFVPSAFSINGVVSTDKTVLQNINSICDAAGCWMAFDISTGKWSVVINQPGDSVASFDDSNIIGGINVSGTGITELYNSGTIEFPHRDLRDQRDSVTINIPEGDRFAKEIDNTLTISTDLINDPIQAQYILNTELKQSRVDKVIQFRTDYSKIGLKAGDLIDVTSEMYGYDSKVFRITRLDEDDSDLLLLSITALEYDESIYAPGTVIREFRSPATGIIPKAVNTTVQTSDAVATSNQNTVGSSEVFTTENITAAVASGTGPIYEFLKVISDVTTAGFKENNPGSSIPSYFATTYQFSGTQIVDRFNDYVGNVTPPGSVAGLGWNGDELPLGIDFPVPACDNMNITIGCPYSLFTLFPRLLNATFSAAYLSYDAQIRVFDGVTTYLPTNVDSDPTLAGIQPELVWVRGDDTTTSQYIPFVNEDAWYIPMRVIVYYDDAGTWVELTRRITNLYTPNFSFSFNSVPETTLRLTVEPWYHSGESYQLYHGAYETLGDLTNLIINLQCISST